MSMRIDQEFMETQVIKPIEKKLKELEAMMWVMKNNIALLAKNKEEKKEKKEVKS